MRQRAECGSLAQCVHELVGSSDVET
jgi:hypothetical protein